MIQSLKKLNAALCCVKFDLRAIILSIVELPRYFKDRIRFNSLQGQSGWALRNYPVLLDRNAGAALLGEYFWQDLFVAKEIIKKNPKLHIDIGSRIDGFIAHLACVRSVKVFDIRPLSAKIENVEFIQWDITNPNAELRGLADCVSCLHTLEHIGLGRYGDKLDPDGWKKGLESLVDLVAPGGGLWLSVPIGIQRVEFNAHRVFDPATIIHAASELEMTLAGFFYLSDAGIRESLSLDDDVESLARKNYSLGIFLFIKDKDESFK